MDESDGPHDRRIELRHDRPGLRGSSGHWLGQEGRASTGHDEREQCFTMRRFDGDVRGDPGRVQGFVDQCPHRRAWRGGNECRTRQATDRQAARGDATPAVIGLRWLDGEDFLIRQRDLDEVGACRQLDETDLRRAGADRGRGVACALWIRDPHAHGGMCFVERGEQVDQRLDCEGGKGDDVEVAGMQPGYGGDGLCRGFGVSQHLSSWAEERLTGCGEADAPPDAGEQVDAELAFQRADPGR